MKWWPHLPYTYCEISADHAYQPVQSCCRNCTTPNFFVAIDFFDSLLAFSSVPSCEWAGRCWSIIDSHFLSRELPPTPPVTRFSWSTHAARQHLIAPQVLAGWAKRLSCFGFSWSETGKTADREFDLVSCPALFDDFSIRSGEGSQCHCFLATPVFPPRQ